MEFIYIFDILFVVDGAEWEDTVVYLTKEEALLKSVKHPTTRIEIFQLSKNDGGYRPTYSYYLNGNFISNK